MTDPYATPKTQGDLPEERLHLPLFIALGVAIGLGAIVGLALVAALIET